jgi:hypothetical protein
MLDHLHDDSHKDETGKVNCNSAIQKKAQFKGYT